MRIERASGLTGIKHERETYPYLGKEYTRKGWQFQRFEGAPSVPDIWVGKEDDYFWVEVKLYRGEKPLTKVTLDDLKFEPGQLRFRHDNRQKCNGGKHYRLCVFNPRGYYVWLE